MRTFSTASRLAPFLISARTDSSCPHSLAYISSVLPACSAGQHTKSASTSYHVRVFASMQRRIRLD